MLLVEFMDTEIWFAIDHRTSECGFVAVASLLRHRPTGSSTKIRVAFVKGEMPPATWWEHKLSLLGFHADLQQVEIDVDCFLNCKGLFDSHAAYLRLVLPHYSKSDLMIYSDADVIFQDDIEGLLREVSLSKASIAMVRAGECCKQPEKEFELLNMNGKSEKSDYFFSGLAVIDNQKYKKQNILEKCAILSEKFSSHLIFHDQTLWNTSNSIIEHISMKWSLLAFPGDKKQETMSSSIIHFMGSPKPWDLGAEILHPYADIWNEATAVAGLAFPKFRKYFQAYSWKRAWRIRRQYTVWKPIFR